jgi:hypothetical protein
MSADNTSRSPAAKLRFTGIATKRFGEAKDNDRYQVRLEWASDVPNPIFKITIKYSSGGENIPINNNRARTFNPRHPQGGPSMGRELITNYMDTAIVIEDYKYDGAAGQNSHTKGDKGYEVTIEYQNPGQQGRDKIVWKVEKFWNPDDNPHSEGDVIRPPFGGR